HFVFIRAPLPHLIVMLFSHIPGFDWYALTMYGMQILAYTLFIYYFVLFLHVERYHGLVWSHVVALFLLLTLRVYSILLLQFTTTATALMGTALFLFADILTHNESFRREGEVFDSMTSRRVGIRLTWLILLIWLVYMIRRNVLFMAIPFLTGFFLLRLILTSNRQLILKRFATVLVATLVLVGITHFLEYKAYNTPAWQQYAEFNVARSHIYDHYAVPGYSECAASYQMAGLSEAEVNVLRIYGLNLVPDVTSEQLDQVATIAADYYHHSFAGMRGRVIFTFRRFRELLVKPDIWPHLAITLFAWLWAIIFTCLPRLMKRRAHSMPRDDSKYPLSSESSQRRHRLWTLLFLCGIFLFLIIVLLYFVWVQRFVLRVVHGLFSYVISGSLFVIMFSEPPRTQIERRRQGGRSVRSLILSVVMAVTFVLSLHSFLPELRHIQSVNITYEKFIGTLSEWGYRDNVLVFPPSAIGQITPGIRFFQPPLENELITLGGWRSRSPLAAEQWQQHGLELSDGYRIFADEDVRLLATNEKVAEIIQALLDESGIHVHYVLERTWMDRDFYVEIYRFEAIR
ncbi:MAG TPA: hypothetical protein GX717_02760, partial [Clostridiaceae bacterium]|nr:hypothetical protein [Clostridiaceae bacterium]